jgi:phospholipid-binding lipoprotein MlaA
MPSPPALPCWLKLALLTCCGTILAGCAGREQIARDELRDPLERANRAVFRFNDAADRMVLRPVTVAYTKALPPQVRTGIHNVLANLTAPATVANDLLQGKPKAAGKSTARFAVNSTIGLLGLFDPASDIGLVEHSEDFGQTLRRWGVPEGPYLMVPLLGPYSLSHGFGRLVDSPISPPYAGTDEVSVTLGLLALDSVDTRAGLLGVDEEARAAFDPYLFVRDAYWQNRIFEILDGDVPEEDVTETLDDDALGDDSEAGVEDDAAAGSMDAET